MDVHTPEQRSRNMASIKARDTKPERIVRSLLFKLGYRFRLHDKKLTGRPDIVLRKHRKIIFVHGCFWHMHNCSFGRVVPKTNTEFWTAKRLTNKKRDKDVLSNLSNTDWKILIIWECQIKKYHDIENILKKFLIEGL